MRDIPESPYASMSRADLEERAKQPNPHRKDPRTGEDISWEAVYCGRPDLLSGHRELLPLLGNALFGESTFKRLVKGLETFEDATYCIRDVIGRKRPGAMVDTLVRKASRLAASIDHAQELYNLCAKKNRHVAVAVACEIAPDKETLVSFIINNEIA